MVGEFLSSQLLPEIRKIKKKYNVEILVIDDGSKDETLEAVQEAAGFSATLRRKKSKKAVRKTAPRRPKIKLKIISFSRNFGKEMALSAGLKNAQGDAVIMIDADGQHPAEIIPKMVEKWENGAKVVTAKRKQNKTHHKLGSKLFYQMMWMMGDRSMLEGATDFRLLDRKVVDEYNKFAEHNRIARGLIDWLGFPQEYISVDMRGRIYGKGTYNFKKLLTLAGDSLISMSRAPLVFFGVLGGFITCTSLPFGLFILVQQYIMGDPLKLDWSGAVAMSVFISFLVGLLLVSQSIAALYISQIHAEAKNRPLFVIDEDKNFEMEVK